MSSMCSRCYAKITPKNRVPNRTIYKECYNKAARESMWAKRLKDKESMRMVVKSLEEMKILKEEVKTSNSKTNEDSSQSDATSKMSHISFIDDNDTY